VKGRRATLIAVVILFLLGFAVYFNSLQGEFVWDDEIAVKGNSHIRSWSNIGRAFTTDIGAGGRQSTNYYYRPVQTLSYMLDYSIWGLNPIGYHLSSIVLHILTALSIYWLMRLLFRDGALPLFTSLLFLIHPIQTESVAAICVKVELITALFMLLTVIAYVKLSEKDRPLLYVWMIFCCSAALFTKENSLVIPALLLLYNFSFKKKINMKAFLIVLTLAVLYIVLRFTILKSAPIHISFIRTAIERVPGFFAAITSYLRLLLLPVHLHAEYGTGLFAFSHPRVITGMLASAGLIVYALRKRRSEPAVTFAVFWFFIALLPMSNIYPLAFYMAEHYLYLPSLGFFVFLALKIDNLFRVKTYRTFSIVSLAALTMFYSYATVKQNLYWRDPVEFCERTLRYSEDNHRLYNNLGLAYFHKGRIEDAIGAYEKAIRLMPDYPRALNNLGYAYYRVGSHDEAIASFEKALAIDPSYLRAYNNLGLVYYGLGMNKEAIAAYEKAIEGDPYYVKAYSNLGAVYYRMGVNDKAAEYFKRSIEIDPFYEAAYYNLALVYSRMGMDEEAAVYRKKRAEIEPHGKALSHTGSEADEVYR